VRKAIWWAILVFGLAVFSLIFYHAWQKLQPEPPAKPAPPAATPPAPQAEPEIRYPVEGEPQAQLPALNESDPAVAEALAGLWDGKTLEQFFNLKDFIRRIVATVDNLPRAKVALRLVPVKPVPGAFATAGTDAGLAVSPANSARYAAYVALMEATDSKKIVAAYVRFYPLFQEAYRELGYPQGYFNDRLVEVIDHLIAAPELQGPARLVRPKVFYLYADPDLEARSAGQKIMMRMGRENAVRVKAKLRELRAELTRPGSKPAQ
jgi:hypothetical protein